MDVVAAASRNPRAVHVARVTRRRRTRTVPKVTVPQRSRAPGRVVEEAEDVAATTGAPVAVGAVPKERSRRRRALSRSNRWPSPRTTKPNDRL